MDFIETQLDMEAFDAAIEKVNYYSFIPSFIKGSSATPEPSCPHAITKEFVTSAHVVDGWTTVINGRLNMPSFCTAN